MQVAENGKILTHVANNAVRQTTMSQASRDMGSGRLNVPARPFASEADRMAAIDEAKREVSVLLLERRTLDARMADLSARAKGRRLRPRDYDTLCADQSTIRSRMLELLGLTTEAKDRLRRLSEEPSAEQAAGRQSHGQRLDSIIAKLDDVLDRLEWIEQKLGRPFVRENDHGGSPAAPSPTP